MKKKIPLEEKTILVPLGNPLNEGVNADLLDSKAVTVAENIVYDQLLRTKKSFGFTAYDPRQWITFHEGQPLFQTITDFRFSDGFDVHPRYASDVAEERPYFGFNFVDETDDVNHYKYYRIGSYSSDATKWRNMGYHAPIRQTPLNVLPTGGYQTSPCSCSNTLYTYVAFTDLANETRLNLHIFDNSSGKKIFSWSSDKGSAISYLHITKSTSYVFVTYRLAATGFIYFARISASSGATPVEGTLWGVSVSEYDIVHAFPTGSGTEGYLCVVLRATAGPNDIWLATFSCATPALVASFDTTITSIDGVAINTIKTGAWVDIGAIMYTVPSTRNIYLYTLGADYVSLSTSYTVGQMPVSDLGTNPNCHAITFCADPAHYNASTAQMCFRWYVGCSITTSIVAPAGFTQYAVCTGTRNYLGVLTQDAHIWHTSLLTKCFLHQSTVHIWVQKQLFVADPKNVLLVAPAPTTPGGVSTPNWHVPVASCAHDLSLGSPINWLPTVNELPTLTGIFQTTFSLYNSGYYGLLHRFDFCFGSCNGYFKNRCKFFGAADHIGGGILSVLNERVHPVGFLNAPQIQYCDGEVGGGGGMTGGAQYWYQLVYTYTDPSGEVHRSCPSTIAHVTLAPGDTEVRLSFTPLYMAELKMLQDTRIYIYRTPANGGTFRRVQYVNNTMTGANGLITFVDLYSDAQIAGNEPIYTDGNILPNITPPPGGVVCFEGNRGMVVADEDKQLIYFTKEKAPGVAWEFSLELARRMPEEIFGLATLDGKVCAFGRNKIYFFDPTDAPTDTGIGTFGNLLYILDGYGINANTGICKSTPIGIVFQRSPNTPIYLMKTIGHIQDISEPIRDSLTEVYAITSLDRESRILFSCPNKLFYFDYLHEQWSYTSALTNCTLNSLASSDTSNRFFATDIGTVRFVHGSSSTSRNYFSDPYGSRIRTPWIKLENVCGFQRVWWVNILLKYVIGGSFTIRLYYDYDLTSYSDYTASGSISTGRVSVKPARQKCQSICVELIETANSSTSLEFSAVEIVCGLKGNHPTSPTQVA